MLTIAQTVEKLDVTTQAIYLWRKGSRRRAALPVVVMRLGESDRVFIPERELRNWLALHRPDLLGRLSNNPVRVQ